MGETLVYAPVLKALNVEFGSTAEWQPARLTAAIQEWLVSHRRLFELRSGKPLTASYYVQLHADKDDVERVLAAAP